MQFKNLNRYKRVTIGSLLLSLLALSTPSYADRLKPFVSDGCSSFPDGTLSQKELWLSCCQRHDYAYWKGGTQEQRLEADRALEVCVSKVGDSRIALLMLAGVRVGGMPYFPTEFRWGYGWEYPRFYKALNDEELQQVKKLTKNLPQVYDSAKSQK